MQTKEATGADPHFIALVVIFLPPSTTSTAPVQYPPALLLKKTKGPTISSSLPARGIGFVLIVSASGPDETASWVGEVISEGKMPGQIELTRTLKGERREASCLVIARAEG